MGSLRIAASALLAACAACSPAPTNAAAESAPETADDELAETWLVRRAVAVEALNRIVERIPRPLAVPAARAELRALEEAHVPPLVGSWDAFQAELQARLPEAEYGARAQEYQATKARFEAELVRLQQDPILWRNVAPDLARFNPIFQP